MSEKNRKNKKESKNYKKENNNKTGISKIEEILSNKYSIGLLFVILFTVWSRMKYFYVESVWIDAYNYYLWGGYNMVYHHILTTEIIQTFAFIPSLVIGMISLFSDGWIAGRIMNLFYAIVGVIFIYYLGKEIKDEKTGLFSAALLSCNHLFFFLSTRMICDVPMTTMYILFAYYLLKFEKEKTGKSAMYLSAVMIMSLLTKLPGLLVYAIFAFYYIIYYKFKILSFLKEKRAKTLILINTVLLSAIILYTYSKANFINYLSGGYGGSIFTYGISYYPKEFLNFLGIYMLPFLIIGLYIVFKTKQKKKELYLLFSWISVYLFVYTFFVKETVARYLLPTLPALILLVVYAIFSVSKNKYINLGFIALILFVCFQSYGIGQNIILSKQYSYIGYKEAGQWMQNNIEKNAIVFSGSRASTRFFLRNHLLNSAIQTKYLSANLTEMSKISYQYTFNNTPVYLQIDAWEYTQPKWAFPFFDQEFENKVKKIEEYNFTIANIIYKELPAQNGFVKTPVVIIFKTNV